MPSTPHPLTDARAQLAEAIQFLGFDDGMRRMLETARREGSVTPPTWTSTRSERWRCG